jgi:hypothetical protein
MRPLRVLFFAVLSLLAVAAARAQENPGGAFPAKIDPAARYVFYLHGRIVEEQGANAVSERFGAYEYTKILQTFRAAGFTVISEVRPVGVEVDAYASRIEGQIRTLLSAGVPPANVTVVGASRGAVIAMQVSTRLRNRKVRYVLLGNCNDTVFSRYRFDLSGEVLSIYETSDEYGGTCRGLFAASTGLSKREEISLTNGLGHGFLYRPLPAWVDPSLSWARDGKLPERLPAAPEVSPSAPASPS